MIETHATTINGNASIQHRTDDGRGAEKRDGAAATVGSTGGTFAPPVIVTTCVRNSPAVW